MAVNIYYNSNNTAGCRLVTMGSVGVRTVSSLYIRSEKYYNDDNHHSPVRSLRIRLLSSIEIHS
eukprot:scaffold25656_cov52-Attheya_sp.AAC.1